MAVFLFNKKGLFMNIIEKQTINEKEASKYIGMSVSFLRQSRMTGKLKGRCKAPPFLKLGRSVRYQISDLDAWLDSNRRIY